MSESKLEGQSKPVPKALGPEDVKRLEAKMPQVIAELDALHEKNRQNRLAQEAEWDAKQPGASGTSKLKPLSEDGKRLLAFLKEKSQQRIDWLRSQNILKNPPPVSPVLTPQTPANSDGQTPPTSSMTQAYVSPMLGRRG